MDRNTFFDSDSEAGENKDEVQNAVPEIKPDAANSSSHSSFLTHTSHLEEVLVSKITEIEHGFVKSKPFKPTKLSSKRQSAADNHEIPFKIPGVVQMRSRNGIIWQTESATPDIISSNDRVHGKPGPSESATGSTEPRDIFQLFFSDDILESIMYYTNEELAQKRLTYRNKSVSSMDGVSKDELYALFGVLILAAVLKNNHLPRSMLFDDSYCGSRFQATMTENRFKALITSMQFDAKPAQKGKPRDCKFTAAPEIWNVLMENCQKYYRPGSHVTIDRRRIYSHDGFYGTEDCSLSNGRSSVLNIAMMCDSVSSYMIDAEPYSRNAATSLEASSVKKLTTSLRDSGRVINMDPSLTSVSLVQELLYENLKVLGGIKNNSPDVPVEFDCVNFQNETMGNCIYAYYKSITAVCQRNSDDELTTVISSMQPRGTNTVQKYRETKESVSIFNRLCETINCCRRTNYTSVFLFYNMLNVACLNAFIIYNHNFMRKNANTDAKPMGRFDFMVTLHRQLVEPWQKHRLAIPSMRRTVRNKIQDVLDDEPETAPPKKKRKIISVADVSGIKVSQIGPRLTCYLCDYRKHRVSGVYCADCEMPVCGQHQIRKCFPCASIDNEVPSVVEHVPPRQ